MRLYYSPDACSLASDIVLHELGIPFELVDVDLATKRLRDGSDYWKVNPKGYVPALELDDGEVLTENVAILPYVADRRPEAGLAPMPGTIERYRFLQWLGFVSNELHKPFGVLFHEPTPEAERAAKEILVRRIAFVDEHLATHTFLLGETFTAVDAYLFVVLRWAKPMKVDVSPFASIRRFVASVGERPAVKAALEGERNDHARAA